ncbi:hypothetical protein HJG60_009144 [Phyllostomus discolor]|uniref:Neugrin n=1 Tax=Phyllostomus discolor TaxID=89673 RepID=A0A833YFL4_9CHIR|nr:hypothetical protein HJG60_009144 [Phyllostomus discolor]
MEAPGAPPRTLTREAMEQIRYLHKEFAESWSVPRLAEGFDVSTDVIRRVLRSKFVPTLEQKLKQDQKVLKKVGLDHALRQLPGSGETWKLLPTCHPASGGEASSQGQGHSTALKVVEPNTHSTDPPSAVKLEELAAGERGGQNFSSKVVQQGREFFDDNGNFLYRI